MQARRCTAYLDQVQAVFRDATSLEICVDDARFSAKEHALALGFTPRPIPEEASPRSIQGGHPAANPWWRHGGLCAAPGSP